MAGAIDSSVCWSCDSVAPFAIAYRDHANVFALTHQRHAQERCQWRMALREPDAIWMR